jgi:hypothetical protein
MDTIQITSRLSEKKNIKQKVTAAKLGIKHQDAGAED